MNNDNVAKKGQQFVEDYYKKLGWEVDPVWKYDNVQPYDLRVRLPEGAWIKLQVKATRRLKKTSTTFRTRKSSGNRKVVYEPGDLHYFVFVDAKSRTMVVRPYEAKSSYSFKYDDWQLSCVKCPK